MNSELLEMRPVVERHRGRIGVEKGGKGAERAGRHAAVFPKINSVVVNLVKTVNSNLFYFRSRDGVFLHPRTPPTLAQPL